ncbi:MAG: hypothetical protein K2L42_06985 [Clostridia bacterium]|nr:hypothetical protein [Clostridia bacterium]
MEITDIYYRAFKAYRKQTKDNTACEKERRALAEADKEADKLIATKYLCRIDEDWIKAIEEGLEFVEKAVAEERQFIRTNGEVVPIEKVRKISKDSVEHLAKHSDMITHVPEEEDGLLVPDKLYMVEKLSDYAVYENRFLYMMLTYIKSFIEFRIEKIEKLRRTYVGDMAVNKEIKTKKRTLRIKTEIYEERTDNPYPVPDEKSAGLVKRIHDCRSIIDALLDTDLMTQVAKTPMIKPPIVKTNVLKMNNNFKNALALYDYIASYKGEGFTYEEVRLDFSPFSENVADELAEATNLTSFLAYKTGNGIENLLQANYEEEERRLKEEEAQNLLKRIQRLKKRAFESNKTMEEYMLLLEERNRRLEKDNEELSALRREVETLKKDVEALVQEKNELNRQMEELSSALEEKEQEIIRLNQKYIEDMSAAKAEHEAETAKIAAEHEEAVTALKAEFADELSKTIEEHEARAGQLNAEIENLNTRLAETVRGCDNKIAEINGKLSELQDIEGKVAGEYEIKYSALEKEYKRNVKQLKDETALIRGELDGIRAEQGKLVPSADYSSRERFVELENAYMAFHRFFKAQWEYTKKEIRKTILWTKQEKSKKK